MTFVLEDRVRENNSGTIGSSAVALAGAVAGNVAFSSVMSNGDTCFYAIVLGAQWEVGLGTYNTAGNTLSRTTVFRSSNSNSLVTFSAGTADVFIDWPGLSGISSAGLVSLRGALGIDVNVTFGDTSPTIAATTRWLATTTTFTAQRTATLPAASGVPAGQRVVVIDVVGAINGANTLLVARAGSDTINGQTGSPLIDIPFGMIELESDGSSKWTIIRFRRGRKVTYLTSGSGTLTTEIGCTQMKARGKGGGGGGGAGGAGGNDGTAGNATTFGTSLFTANGGSAGKGGTGGAGGGGTATGGNLNLTGEAGAVGASTGASATISAPGGNGGGEGRGSGGTGVGAAVAAAANSGAGGGGGGYTSAGSGTSGGGGGEGGTFEAVIIGPAASYAWAVGALAAGGTIGSGSTVGAAGGSGLIIVEQDFF